MSNEFQQNQAQSISSELEVYDSYQNVIAPLILSLEVLDNEFPIEILNEIRSIFTHISRYKLQGNKQELVSAQRHVKRAILDCYKYHCVSYIERLQIFRHEYRDIDLHLADSGKFLPRLGQLEVQAKEKLILAKKFEIEQKQETDESKDVEKLYVLYEEAFIAYFEVNTFLESSYEALLFASTHTKNKEKIDKRARVIGYIGTGIGIAGFIVGLISIL